MTPEDLAKLKAKFPISETVARLSLGAGVQPIGVTVSCPLPDLKKPLSPEEKLNKTEREFLARLRAGVYGSMEWIGIQCITLKLGDDCRYTADFASIKRLTEHLILWEVKGGHIWEDSTIKLKTAAHQFQFITFIRAQKKKGEWTETIIGV